MTALELQRTVLLLANNGWCRYWLRFLATEAGVWMAIQTLKASPEGATPNIIPELESRGFKLSPVSSEAKQGIYIILRTNEDGTPFVWPNYDDPNKTTP